MALPQEIYDEIVSYLLDDNVALKPCSLAFRGLLSASQKGIFSDVTLCTNQENNRPSRPRFQHLLASSPHIAAYVRSLRIIGERRPRNNWFYHPDNTLEFCLSHLPRLSALAICGTEYSDETRPIFQNGLFDFNSELKQFSSITNLALSSVTPDLLCYCPNLKHLSLCDIRTYIKPLTSGNFGQKKCIYLESLELEDTNFGAINWMDENIVFNLTGLKNLHIFYYGRDYSFIGSLLKASARPLEEFVCDLRDPWGLRMKPNYVDPIDWKPLRGLKRYCIVSEGIYDGLRDGMLFAGLPPWWMNVFRELSSSSLEEFILQISYTREYWEHELHDMSSWTELMGSLSDRDNSPHLRKVHIRIASRTVTPYLYEKLEKYIENLQHALGEVDCKLLEILDEDEKISPFAPVFMPEADVQELDSDSELEYV